jgi:ABC-type polysaccharide/polyol phosphate transport system ATPase subunit
MIEEPVIRFNHVTKRFKLARASSSLFESLLHRLYVRRLPIETLLAVNAVSFDVRRGESVGLIGHNGSGKSTLLKLATKILRPSEGEVAVFGRISALLELGAGFHEDLTGRENIYLNGSVLGLGRAAIDAKIGEIIAFSELDQFIDTPVKHYSSGMYMRLGFSVAVHCDPDVLLVDEILAVGDGAFQRKCLDRIQQLKAAGVTIVMVSHHLETLQKLCDRLVWMDHGEMVAEGGTAEISERYTAYMNERIAAQGGAGFVANRSGTYEAEITRVRFLDGAGNEQLTFFSGEPLTMELRYMAHRPIANPEIGFAIFHENLQLTGDNNRQGGCMVPQIEGEGTILYHIENLSLLPGRYQVSAAIHDSVMPVPYDFHDRAYRLTIMTKKSFIPQGIVHLSADWQHRPTYFKEQTR